MWQYVQWEDGFLEELGEVQDNDRLTAMISQFLADIALRGLLSGGLFWRGGLNIAKKGK